MFYMYLLYMHGFGNSLARSSAMFVIQLTSLFNAAMLSENHVK